MYLGLGLSLASNLMMGVAGGEPAFGLDTFTVTSTASGAIVPLGATIKSFNVKSGSNISVTLYDSPFSNLEPGGGTSPEVYAGTGLGTGVVDLSDIETVAGCYAVISGTTEIDFEVAP